MAVLDELNTLDTDAAARMIGPLFEDAPRYIGRLLAARPFETEDAMFDEARAVARSMPEDEQIELLNAHPRIGAVAAGVSELSRREQGLDEPAGPGAAWIADELLALNEAYESLFGFRYVIFVAGRPRADIIPLLERALHADRDEEIRRGLDDVVLIAHDRWATIRGPDVLREELREAIALEISRWMVEEIDRDGLRRAAHRLIDEGIASPALLALSLAASDEDVRLEEPVSRVAAEIGLGGWDMGQARQLLAMHAAASILGQVSQPIDGARRIAHVTGDRNFDAMVRRWEAESEQRAAIDAQIRRAAAELFGPPDEAEEEET